MSVQNARSRLESIEEQLTHCRILRKITYYVTKHSSAYNGRTPWMRIMGINKPLVDEIIDFPDIIYQNNNYVENLHATGNNVNKNIIFVHQFYIPKHLPIFNWIHHTHYKSVFQKQKFSHLQTIQCSTSSQIKFYTIDEQLQTHRYH